MAAVVLPEAADRWGGSPSPAPSPRAALELRPPPVRGAAQGSPPGGFGALAATVVGRSSGRLFDEAVALLAAHGPLRAPRLAAAVERLAQAAGAQAARERASWLERLVGVPLHVGEALARAIARGSLEPLDADAWSRIAERLGALPRPAQPTLLAGALLLAQRARPGERAPAVAAALGAVQNPRMASSWRHDPCLRFLDGWLPAATLEGPALAAAIGCLARLGQGGRSRLVRQLGHLISLPTAEVGSGLWAAVASLPGRRLEEQLQGLDDKQVVAWMQRLAPADAVAAMAALLRLAGSLPQQLRAVFLLGEAFLGRMELQPVVALSALPGTSAGTGASHTRAWARAARAHLTSLPEAYRLMPLRLLAAAPRASVGALAASLGSLLGRLAGAADGPSGVAAAAAEIARWSALPTTQVTAALEDLAEALPPPPRATSAAMLGWARVAVDARQDRSEEALPWPALLGTAIALTATRPGDAREVLDALVEALPALTRRDPEAPLASFRSFAARYLPRADPGDLAGLVDGLAQVPGSLRSVFDRAVGPLLAAAPPPCLFGALLDYCLRGPQEAGSSSGESDDEVAGGTTEPSPRGQARWAEVWRGRAAHCVAFPELRVDGENVMDAGRIRRADEAIGLLAARFVRMSPAAEQAQLERLFAALAAAADSAGLSARRAGATEAEHAHRVLFGPLPAGGPPLMRRQDTLAYRGPLPGRITLRRLLACVAAAIDQLAEGEPGLGPLLVESLLRALGQCIDEAGPRLVCPTGISQRLLSVLQGYDPAILLDLCTPQQLLCELGREFDRAQPEPDAADLASFRTHARRVGQRQLGANSPAMALFDRHLDQFIASFGEAMEP